MPNDKIPDDIMAAAREAVAQEWCFCPELAEEVRAGLKDDSITICSTIRAVAAERERCIRIFFDHEAKFPTRSLEWASESIVDAIRGVNTSDDDG